jgi:hypothetical protein
LASERLSQAGNRKGARHHVADVAASLFSGQWKKTQEATVKVNEQHFERAAGVVTEAMRKALGAGVDRGAMTMAFLSVGFDEMRKADGEIELSEALRRFADRFADRLGVAFGETAADALGLFVVSLLERGHTERSIAYAGLGVMTAMVAKLDGFGAAEETLRDMKRAVSN